MYFACISLWITCWQRVRKMWKGRAQKNTPALNSWAVLTRVPIAVALAYVKSAAILYARWSTSGGPGNLISFSAYYHLSTDKEKRYYLAARLAAIRAAVEGEFLERMK